MFSPRLTSPLSWTSTIQTDSINESQPEVLGKGSDGKGDRARCCTDMGFFRLVHGAATSSINGNVSHLTLQRARTRLVYAAIRHRCFSSDFEFVF